MSDVDVTLALVDDSIDHPVHYNAGDIEVIVILEQTIDHAPDPVTGALQWSVLKYLLRMWHKGAALSDARKAAWYLDRLITRLENYHG